MKYSLKQTGLFLYLLIAFGFYITFVPEIYPQQEDIQQRFDWLYGQRYYPYTTLPSNVLSML